MKVKTKKIIRKPRNSLSTRKKFCRFCLDKTKHIDYKDVKLLESFIKERGKMVASRISGNCAWHQRRMSEEIKKARLIALLPYIRL